MSHPYAKLSRELKAKCLAYIVEHLEEDFKQSPIAKAGISDDLDERRYNVGNSDYPDPNTIFGLDSFLLFGETQEGEDVIEVVRGKGKFNKEEKEILFEWQKHAFQSVFEIVETVGEDSVKLLDTVGEAEYIVYGNGEEDIVGRDFAKPRHFLYTHLAPVKGVWFFSGIQSLYPPEAAGTIYNTYVKKQLPPDLYRNNPGKLQKAFDLQQKEYDRFVKFFGTDEVICKGSEVNRLLKAYYESWYKEMGRVVGIVPAFDSEITEQENIGMVMDKREGMHFFVDYGIFTEMYNHPASRPNDWKEMIASYLIEESIPAFVFKRVSERYPENFRNIMREALKDERLGVDPLDDFDDLMGCFKPDWREMYPSVHPMNERFRKYFYRNDKIGRNDPCPCQSGKKFKKCCGI